MTSVWVAFPTANSDAADAVLAKWHDRGYRSAVLIDKGQRHPQAHRVIELGTDYPGFARATNPLCHCCVENGTDIVVVAGDDISPDEGAAGDIAARFMARFPDTFGVMQPMGDAYGAIRPDARIKAAVSPWIGREFIRRVNGGHGIYHEGYGHLWADTELWHVAELLGVLQQEPGIKQYHAHWTRGHADNLPREKRKRINDQESIDRRLFKERQAAGFPGHQPIP